MRTVAFLLMCALLWSCARRPEPPGPPVAQPPVLREMAVLAGMHERFLAFRDDEIFLRYGFTYNSPYADWLELVRDLEQDPAMTEAARLLSNLAVAARLHGVRSEVYGGFDRRFQVALRGPEALAAMEGPETEERPDVETPPEFQVSLAAGQGAESKALERRTVEQVLELLEQQAAEQGAEREALERLGPEQAAQPEAAARRTEERGAPPGPPGQRMAEPQQPRPAKPGGPQASRVGSAMPAAVVSILFSGDTRDGLLAWSGPGGAARDLARRGPVIDFFRFKDPGLVLLDAGDAFVSGGEPAGVVNKALVRVMNHLRYDAMGLGPHDLAMGEVALRELVAMARFPLICSNLRFQPGVAPWIEPYAIFQRNGRRVAVLSLMPVPPGATVTGARFIAPAEALAELAPTLRARADCIVLLSQLGPDQTAALPGAASAVDVVLGDSRAFSRPAPAYVPAVPKGGGFGLVRLTAPEAGKPPAIDAMPVLPGQSADAQLLEILKDLK